METDSRLSCVAVLSVLLVDGCAAYVLGLLLTVFFLRMNCSWFRLGSHCLFLVLVTGWYAWLPAGHFYCGVVVDIELE
jgi:hypothetical protein